MAAVAATAGAPEVCCFLDGLCMSVDDADAVAAAAVAAAQVARSLLMALCEISRESLERVELLLPQS